MYSDTVPTTLTHADGAAFAHGCGLHVHGAVQFKALGRVVHKHRRQILHHIHTHRQSTQSALKTRWSQYTQVVLKNGIRTQVVRRMELGHR